MHAAHRTQERPALASGGGSAGRNRGILTVVEGPREEHLHHPRGPQGCPGRVIPSIVRPTPSGWPVRT